MDPSHHLGVVSYNNQVDTQIPPPQFYGLKIAGVGSRLCGKVPQVILIHDPGGNFSVFFKVEVLSRGI